MLKSCPRSPVLAIGVLLGPSLSAQDAEGPTGNPLHWLADRGVEITTTYLTDTSAVLSGGADQDVVHRSLLDVVLALDLERIAGMPGATVGFEFYSRVGNDGSELVGDLQVFSNIDAGRLEQMAELWYQQVFLDDALRLKVGKVDANSEFAYVEAAGEFINSSFGFSPSLFTLPTYPDPSTSVNLFWTGFDGTYVGLGVYDGQGLNGVATGRRGLRGIGAGGDDVFFIAEVGRSYEEGPGGLPGRLALGGAHHTATVEEFGGGQQDGVESWYLAWEQGLRRSSDGLGDLDGFLQLGYSSPSVAEIHAHLGAGVAMTGPLATRPEDSVGLAATWALVSDEADLADTGELALETYWRFQVSDHLALKPDLQFIVDPGADDQFDDALVLTLRAELSF